MTNVCVSKHSAESEEGINEETPESQGSRTRHDRNRKKETHKTMNSEKDNYNITIE